MIRFKSRGSFEKTEKFLKHTQETSYMRILKRYGEIGVKKLAEATPVRTGKTAASWVYKYEKTNNGYTIYWTNTNIQNGIQIVLLLEHGHMTKDGTYVQGRHFIEPAMADVYSDLAIAVWEEVSSS